MAPPKVNKTLNKPKNANTLQDLYTKYVNFAFLKYLAFEPAALPIAAVLILLGELIINLIVIKRVPYTEIDWVAYMQECEGFLNGTTNYALLRGDTGPLVYPAAFVYIYSALYYITTHGSNVRLAQYIFAFIYLLQMWLVLRLYTKSRKVPPYVLVLSAFTSYRVHSIYVLRLFNDPVAILLLYIALNLFMDQRWSLGSICFSLAVGVKMNILLFAPALLLFYLANLGYIQTIYQLLICAVVQLVLGAPFLLTYPVEYIKGSFDLGRIFEHKWTVNYRFLPLSVFEHKYFHMALLALHLALLLLCAKPAWIYFKSYIRLRALQKQFRPQLERRNREIANDKLKVKKPKATAAAATKKDNEPLSNEQQSFLKAFEKTLQKSTGQKAPNKQVTAPTTNGTQSAEEPASEKVGIHFDQCTQLALLPFFLANFIGVACARSLHYQFYVWYFHTLPYLAWSTPYTLGVRYLLLGLIEYCWNTYPSTNFSSYVLHLCHVILLVGVLRQLFRTTSLKAYVGNELKTQQKKATKGN